MKIKIITAILIMAFLISGWAPAAKVAHAAADNSTETATSYPLVVNNKTGQVVQLKLVGPATYNFTVKSGKNTFTVQEGKYKYSYFACNGTKTGTVVVGKTNKLLTLAACKAKGKPVKTIKFNIVNDTSGTITLILNGPASYNFSLSTGKHVLSVVKGKYTYTAYGCGSSMSGTVNLRQGLIWRFWCR